MKGGHGHHHCWQEECRGSPQSSTVPTKLIQPKEKVVSTLIFPKCLLEFSEASNSHAKCSALEFEYLQINFLEPWLGVQRVEVG